MLKEKSRASFRFVAVVSAAISVYGVYAFGKRQFPDYMLRKTAFVFFDFHEPRVLFFLDYFAVMLLFVVIGCLVVTGLSYLDRNNRLDFLYH